MTGLLIHDICNEQACSQPGVPLDNPLHLFAEGAVHGGMWRTPYQLRTYIEFALLYFFAEKYRLQLLGAGTAAALGAALLTRRALAPKARV
jgi:hypothetical protein